MARRITTTLILMFTIFFSGCRFVKEIANPTSAPRSTWLKEFLESPVCQPPCWNNITPAQTTIDEANKILQINPTIKIINIYPDSIEWEFLPTGGNGYVESQYNKNTVDIIYLGLGTEQYLTLGDVIKNYSDPTYIHFEQNMHNLKRCFFFVFYESSGVVFSNRDLPCKELKQGDISTVDLDVSPDIILNSITMVATGDRFAEYAGSVNPINWKGYGNYVREYRRK